MRGSKTTSLRPRPATQTHNELGARRKALAVQHDIGRLDVAVHQVALVHGHQARRHAYAPPQARLCGGRRVQARALVQALVQTAPRQQLRGNAHLGCGARLADQAHDVGVRWQRRQGVELVVQLRRVCSSEDLESARVPSASAPARGLAELCAVHGAKGAVAQLGEWKNKANGLALYQRARHLPTGGARGTKRQEGHTNLTLI